MRVTALLCTRNGRSRDFRQKNAMVWGHFPSDPLLGLLWPLASQMPLSSSLLPVGSQMASTQERKPKQSIDVLQPERRPKQVGPKVPKLSPKTAQKQSKVDKRMVLELVLKKFRKMMKKTCPRKLKNSGFALEGCIFQGLQYLQKVVKHTPDIVSNDPQIN